MGIIKRNNILAGDWRRRLDEIGNPTRTTTRTTKNETTKKQTKKINLRTTTTFLVSLLLLASAAQLSFQSGELRSSSATFFSTLRVLPVAPTASQNKDLVGCDMMSQIKIVEKIAEGHQKVVYKVKLPSGQLAIAKQCTSKNCVESKLLSKEASYLRNLQEQYGNENTLNYFGECDDPEGSYPMIEISKGKTVSISTTSRSTGYTYFAEYGKPLVFGWENLTTTGEFRNCFGLHYTAADEEDFRVIARQYANYSIANTNGTRTRIPLTLGPCGYHHSKSKGNDNIFASNYVVAKTGIRHVDLDMLNHCPGTTYDEVLSQNCLILAQNLRRVKRFKNRFDCSLEYSMNHPVSDLNSRINATKAKHLCLEKVRHILPN